MYSFTCKTLNSEMRSFEYEYKTTRSEDPVGFAAENMTGVQMSVLKVYVYLEKWLSEVLISSYFCIK